MANMTSPNFLLVDTDDDPEDIAEGILSMVAEQLHDQPIEVYNNVIRHLNYMTGAEMGSM